MPDIIFLLIDLLLPKGTKHNPDINKVILKSVVSIIYWVAQIYI